MSENSELFKKLNSGAQFQWERISFAVQPRRSLRGSETETTTSSRYSSFRGRERSLDSGRLQKAAWHLRTNGVLPIGLRQPSASESEWRRWKVRLAFCLHTTSPRQGSDWRIPSDALVDVYLWRRASPLCREYNNNHLFAQCEVVSSIGIQR